MNRAMGRDEDKFVDVDDFKPERLLSEEGKLKDGAPMSANPIFGLGRRICERSPLCLFLSIPFMSPQVQDALHPKHSCGQLSYPSLPRSGSQRRKMRMERILT